MNSNKNSSRGRQQGKKTTSNTSKPKFDSKKKFTKSFKDKPVYKKDRPVSKETATPKPEKKTAENEGIRLNKYISNSGICSRREADVYIKAGSASVNGKYEK